MKTVFWDFDGTLGKREGGWSGTLYEVLKAEMPDTAIILEQFRGKMKYGFPWHNPDIPHPELSPPDKWWSVIEKLIYSAYKEVGIDAELAKRLAGKYRTKYLAREKWTLFDDAIPVLQEFSRRGWQQAIISNHVPEFRSILDYLGISDKFVAIINSAETGYEKPHPRAFQIALERIGNPSPAWMIGDNIEADYLGAERAGLTPILVRRPDPRAQRFSEDLMGALKILP